MVRETDRREKEDDEWADVNLEGGELGSMEGSQGDDHEALVPSTRGPRWVVAHLGVSAGKFRPSSTKLCRQSAASGFGRQAKRTWVSDADLVSEGHAGAMVCCWHGCPDEEASAGSPVRY